MKIIRNLFLLFFIFNSNVVFAEEVIVEKEHFNCLVQNLSAYSQSENDPVLIFLDICPNITPDLEAILNNSTNNLPDINSGSSQGSSETHVISYTKKELECLSAKAENILKNAEEGEEFIRLPLEICAN